MLTPTFKPEFLTIQQWCAYTGMSRTGTDAALRRGDLRAKRLGRRVLVDVAQGTGWLRSLPDHAPRPEPRR